MKLALGTAQFGMPYGLDARQASPEEVQKIFTLAKKNDLSYVDTAYAYGESETVLGKIVGQDDFFKIISKFPAGYSAEVGSCVRESLEKLQRKSLYAYLLHDIKSLRDRPELWDNLLSLKDQGIIQKVGLSVYFPRDLQWFIEQAIPLDIVQVPYSIFDQRFDPIFDELKRCNIEIHARSVFLQGVIFNQDLAGLPFFYKLLKPLAEIKKLGEKHNLSLASIFLNFALCNPHIDQVVIGVDSADNLAENIKVTQDLPRVLQLRKTLMNYGLNDEEVILPFNWKKERR